MMKIFSREWWADLLVRNPSFNHPNIDLIRAFVRGIKIECFSPITRDWCDNREMISFGATSYNYRIAIAGKSPKSIKRFMD